MLIAGVFSYHVKYSNDGLEMSNSNYTPQHAGDEEIEKGDTEKKN